MHVTREPGCEIDKAAAAAAAAAAEGGPERCVCILDDVRAARPERRPERVEGCALVADDMRAVVEDDVKAARLGDEPREQRRVGLVAEVRARPVPPRPAPVDRRRPPPTAPRRLPLLRRSRASPTRSSTRW